MYHANVPTKGKPTKHRVSKQGEMREYASSFASLGGKARAKRLTPEQRREIARKAVQARWARAKARKKDQERFS